MNVERSRLPIYLSPLERKAVDDAAKRTGLPTSTYVREVLLNHLNNVGHGTNGKETATAIQNESNSAETGRIIQTAT